MFMEAAGLPVTHSVTLSKSFLFSELQFPSIMSESQLCAGRRWAQRKPTWGLFSRDSGSGQGIGVLT